MNFLFDKLPYWEFLSEDQKKEVSEMANTVHYKSGNILFSGGGDKGLGCLGAIYVISGELRAYVVSREGREITLFHISKDESCVLSAACIVSQINFDIQLVVTRDAEILIVPAMLFDKLTKENLHVKCYMYEIMIERFSAIMWVMQTILFDRFDERLASFLIGEYEKNGSLQIKMTQEQIAQHVNSAREVVARMLRQFSLEGLIDHQRGMIEIKDINGLKSMIK